MVRKRRSGANARSVTRPNDLSMDCAFLHLGNILAEIANDAEIGPSAHATVKLTPLSPRRNRHGNEDRGTEVCFPLSFRQRRAKDTERTP